MSRGMIVGAAVAALLVGTGCSGSREMQVTQQTTLYSSMESTALVYTEPSAASILQDHPLRWAGFVLHPLGVALDYAVNRPFYGVASTWPGLFGFTGEDAMVHSQRPGVIR